MAGMTSSPRNSIGNVRSDMDIAYPEHLSRLHRHSVLTDYAKCYYNPKKNTRNRRGNRYRTQPVTFDEIQEVDEEGMVTDNQNSESQSHPMSASLSTSKLELDFYRFTKALGAKMKTQAVADGKESMAENTKKVERSNGTVQGLHSKPDDPHRWIECAREGSI